MRLANTFFTHRKVDALTESLGLGTEALPLRLWAYVCEHHGADGRLSGYTAKQIERIVGWKSTPGKFAQAMVEVGWLEVLPDGGGYQCHQWTEHQPAVYSAAQVEALLEAERVRWSAQQMEAERARLEREAREAERRRERAALGGFGKAAKAAAAEAGAEAGPAAAPQQGTTVPNSSTRIPVSVPEKTLKSFDLDNGPGGLAASRPTGQVPGQTGIEVGDREDAFGDGQSPAFVPASGGGISGGANGHGGSKREGTYGAGAIPAPNVERTPAMVDRALGMVRRELQTVADTMVGRDYCTELDTNHGGPWGKFAHKDPGALIAACLDLHEAKAKARNGQREPIRNCGSWLNRSFQEHYQRRQQGLESRRNAGL